MPNKVNALPADRDVGDIDGPGIQVHPKRQAPVFNFGLDFCLRARTRFPNRTTRKATITPELRVDARVILGERRR